MKPETLLKEIRKDQRDAASAFMTERPPHPAELGALDETRKFAGGDNSNYDEIEIVRCREPHGNHVCQEIFATGTIIQGPDPKENLKTFLGSWGRDEFPKKVPQSGPEMD